MTCQEAIAILGDYLESLCGPDLVAELERHLEQCAPCRAYLNTYQATRAAAADASRVEMPHEMKQRLRAVLLRALAERP